MPSKAVKNNVYRIDGDFDFTEFTDQWGFDSPSFSNGMAYGDLDNDGDQDIVINNVNMKSVLNMKLDSDANQSFTVGGDQFDSTATKPQFVFDAATYRWDPNLPIDIPFVSLDSAVFLNGVALREVIEDHLDNFFGVDSNNAVTITYDDVANTMTWKGTDASTTQKGVSSFDSSNFTITAGHVSVTVLDGGTY